MPQPMMHRKEVLWLNNPYNLQDVTKAPVLGKMTIQQWVDANGGEDRLNERPTVCVYRGKQLMRAEYKEHLITAPVCFVTLPQDGGEGGSNPLGTMAMIGLSFAAPWLAGPAMMGFTGVTAQVVSAGIMMAGGMLINAVLPPPSPPNAAIASQGSPTYTASAQGNLAARGQPIPVNYGRFPFYPQFGAQPYSVFEGNDQILYMLFCLGQGYHHLERKDIFFENTPIDHFDSVNVQIAQPQEKITLFPTGVVNAPEAGGQDMNDTSTQGPFVLTEVGKECSQVSVDLVFPAGLISMNDEGDEYSATVHVKAWADPIDDQGNITGDSIPLFDEKITRRTRTAQRVTLSGDVEPGRYQVTIQRLTRQGGNYDAWNMQLFGIKAYLVSDNEYGDVTMVAMRLKVNENISNTASRKVKMVPERMLPVWHPDNGWSEPVITRSPVWAFCDAIRSRYGGDMADHVLPLNELYQQAQYLDERSDEFSGRFDVKSNLWEALQKIGQVCRCAPVRQGNQIRMVRDQLQTVPDMVFTMANMRNFVMDFALHSGADSVKVTYFDEEKDHKEQVVLCKLPGSAGLNPKNVTLFGCTSREQAWREGMYLAASNLRRIPVSWETEMEGYIPRFGSAVLVNHDLLGKGKMYSGEVVRNLKDFHDNQTGLVDLSRDVELEGDHWYVGFTNVYGEPVGPLRIEPVEGKANRIKVVDPWPDGYELVVDPDLGRSQFAIGQGSEWCRKVKITGILPAADDMVKISGVLENDAVHTADEGKAPAPLPDYGLVLPSIGPVEGLTATQGGTVNNPILNLSWIPVSGADRYHVEWSTDEGETWQPYNQPVYFPEVSISVEKGPVKVRVAAVSALRGEWRYLDVQAGSDFSKPGNLTLRLSEPFTGASMRVEWDHEPSAARYLVEVWAKGKRLRGYYIERPDNFIEYTWQQAQTDAAGRTITIKAIAENANGVRSEQWAELTATNPSPAVPNNVQAGGMLNQILVTMDIPVEKDIRGVRVWASTTKGFTPDSSNMKVFSETTTVNLPVNPNETWYIRVAFEDLWGSDGLNISGEYQAFTTLITETEIEKDSIKTPHLAANAVTADKCFIQSLSALSANMGTVTGGTFRTDAAAGVRVEISSVGNYPFWIGTGTKTYNNAQLVYDKGQNLLTFKGKLSIRSATSGGRLEIVNDQIRVYDASNRLRVELGKLS